jgi:type IV pilus assembly protein PilW
MKRLRALSSSVVTGSCGQGGFSLVELMVGLVISLIVMFALTVLFANNSRTRQQIDLSTQQIENGRYALDLLRDDLHLAGYYGGVVPQLGYVASSATTPDVCATTVANIQFNLSPLQWPVPVFGVPDGDAAPTCVTTPGKKTGTDVLVVRRTKTASTAVASLDSTRIYVQATGCRAELAQHKDFARESGSQAGTFALHARGCGAVADVYEYQTRIYYISDEAIPTLRVLTISGATSTNEPLVEGIENMQIQFGRDTSGDGGPDEYRKCLASGATPDPCSSVDWANMMSVRIDILARNLSPTAGYSDNKTYQLGAASVGPFSDGFKRHAYTAVVRLMNPAGLRERGP